MIVFLLAVYIYVYLTGQTVSRRGGGTILYWTPTYGTDNYNYVMHLWSCCYRRVAVPQRRFRSENITIALNASASTAKLNISNIKTFTVWCQPFAVFFTRLDLPANVKIPPIAVSDQILSMHLSMHLSRLTMVSHETKKQRPLTKLFTLP